MWPSCGRQEKECVICLISSPNGLTFWVGIVDQFYINAQNHVSIKLSGLITT